MAKSASANGWPPSPHSQRAGTLLNGWHLVLGEDQAVKPTVFADWKTLPSFCSSASTKSDPFTSIPATNTSPGHLDGPVPATSSESEVSRLGKLVLSGTCHCCLSSKQFPACTSAPACTVHGTCWDRTLVH